VVDALKLGASDYVTKPFDLPVVLARVQTQIALKRSVDQITRLERSLEQRNKELETANIELAEANRRMKRDLEAAAKIQQALLPAVLPAIPGTSFALRFKPCTELAGDLLNIFQIDDKHVSLYVMDVVGHGVAAALLAVMVNRALTRMQLLSPPAGQPTGDFSSRPLLSPAEVASQLSKDFPWDSRTEQFFTLIHGILNLDTWEFRFISAGHPGPIYLPRGAVPKALDVPGPPIGLGDGNYEENTLNLKPGDRLYLYSDGISDAMNTDNKRFGLEKLVQVLDKSRATPLEGSLAILLSAIEEWCGRALPHDDISVLAAEVVGSGAGSG
jgi:sigma-B regulation protein RsbU (phosphoserine phosphatase)